MAVAAAVSGAPRLPGEPPDDGVVAELAARFPDVAFTEQQTADGIPTLWLAPRDLHAVVAYLKNEAEDGYRTLWDLTAIDERLRGRREGQPSSDFSGVYHLVSYRRNADVRLKVPLEGQWPTLPSVQDLWPAASWYEREVWDMFGVGIEGHPDLRRILNPPWWEGYPLRKEHASRGTEMGPFRMDSAQALTWQEELAFRPEEHGLEELAADPDVMFLNVGPQHGGTHGVVHITIGLRGERILSSVVDIGYHHRGQEKIAERQSWHTYIPYTDRVDYLGGVLNNLNYLVSVERLAGIEVPPRARVIRVMLCEFYRVLSHLLYYGTYAQDIGALSPIFYMFVDREYAFQITSAICGDRMHPNWFRIGGVAEDLPAGWEAMVREFLDMMPARLKQYDELVINSRITKARTKGVGAITLDDAVEWGFSGPNLRACGLEFDYRKKRPYSGYEDFEFDIPTATNGDCYDRLLVRVEEIRQSLRIIRQCVDNMPDGPYKALHPLAQPPMKEPGTMHDIETLIHHFLGVSWGPVIPAGEAVIPTESNHGATGYYCVSDGGTSAYRMHIRTPSFPHLQALPLMANGMAVADLFAILGSIDFVMSDVDR